MTEQILSGDKLSSELEFVKRQIDTLGTLKLEHANDFVEEPEHRSKKPTLANIRVVEPPKPKTGDDQQGIETIQLTIKSAKPPLNFTLSVASTSSIAAAKAQLAAQETDSPAPEAQRWILKGKAMGDTKLLKEFNIADGAATVNLMVSKPTSGPTATPPALDLPPATATAADPATPSSVGSGPDPMSLGPIPSLTLSTDPMPSPTNPTAPKLSIETDLLANNADFLPPSTATGGDSEAFISTIGDPELWIETYAMLLRRFGSDERGERKAKKVWEAWLMGARDWIQPGTKALIREKTGISAMGGEA